MIFMIPVCYYFICITVGSCKKIIKLLRQFMFTLFTQTSLLSFDQAWKPMLIGFCWLIFKPTLALRLYPVNNNEW